MRREIVNLKFRRRRESLTDYRKRLALVKSGMDRVVIRKTNKRILAQIVRYTEKGDVTAISVDSNELEDFKWSPRANRPTAYLTGLLLARKLKAEDAQKEHILDIGLSSPVKNSIPFVFAKGCIDGGMKLRGSIEIDEKVYNYSNVKHVMELKEKDPDGYKRQYGKYLEKGAAPETLHKSFTDAKAMILARK
ncbi:MAG: 50S ribosomal protein L18 [Candidatus Micrarchaeota archaeon]|nr:50S ribosomal protein L18 [Candidatus Micrarchaeota archaeon]